MNHPDPDHLEADDLDDADRSPIDPIERVLRDPERERRAVAVAAARGVSIARLPGEHVHQLERRVLEVLAGAESGRFH